jgi:hypothetical protein
MNQKDNLHHKDSKHTKLELESRRLARDLRVLRVFVVNIFSVNFRRC